VFEECSDGVLVIREGFGSKRRGSFVEIVKQLQGLKSAAELLCDLDQSHLFDDSLKVPRSSPLHFFLRISGPLIRQMCVDFVVRQRC